MNYYSDYVIITEDLTI